ncbi:hypothetical protein IAD21_01218 [Abditibacteriota bacterium]|nr:hypothetical protein IAD21_01218 [Abditibacteriota bacterium]
MNYERDDVPKMEESDNNVVMPPDYEPPGIEEAWPMERTKPMIAGRRYKRPTMSSHFRPYVVNKKSEVPGDAKEMEAVLEARKVYLRANSPQETIQEIEEDWRSLQTVLKDFPHLSEFIGELKTARTRSLERLEIIKDLRRELVKVAGEKAALQTQSAIDRAIEQETGLVTVAMLVREYGYGSRAGVTKHLRALKEEGLIRDSSARDFGPNEVKIIRERLSKSSRLKRN